MARSLQVLCLLSRLGDRSVSSHSCRFASRVASKAWIGQSHVNRDRVSNRAPRYKDEVSDEDLGLEGVEDKLQALVDEERKWQKTVKYKILKRQMTPSGAPERKLTWEAIEQIRYLKQEQPEEWTVQRLAEGFSVTPDVILRVLRSKFIPAPDRKAKQDGNAMARLSQAVLPRGAGSGHGRLKLPGNISAAALPPGGTEGGLVPVAEQTRRFGGSGSLVSSPAPVTVTVLPSRFTVGVSEEATETITSTGEDNAANSSCVEDGDYEDSWDGQVLSEDELEGLMGLESPAPPVQAGKEFFDAEGNFLYRI